MITSTSIGMVMAAEAALYRLMSWLSPAFPVGAYTYSHGLEYAVEIGQVRDRGTAAAWIAGIVVHGAGRLDADLFRDAHRAVMDEDDDALGRVAALAAAARGTAEQALENTAQGRAFLSAALTSWPAARLERFADELALLRIEPSYAVVVAVAAAAHRIPVRQALTAYLHALAANLISAAVRLIPLGQSDGQRIVADLETVVILAAAASLDRPAEDFGAAAPVVDWTSMQHETQYTRLFRS